MTAGIYCCSNSHDFHLLVIIGFTDLYTLPNYSSTAPTKAPAMALSLFQGGLTLKSTDPAESKFTHKRTNLKNAKHKNKNAYALMSWNIGLQLVVELNSKKHSGKS
ncbi:hypothetical protein H5410_011788 [Solanum commersonii]|uniref:Uncharacterized protein n=1 Tax=Solanum commersonii TaxID=4109 RepID=A0A9J6AQW2_SOLCO|nr:hypothetical protein H5410_011788 [Solanum commersonii]